MDTVEARAALVALKRGDVEPARRLLAVELADGLPTTQAGLERHFTRVWKRHAQPVLRRGRGPRMAVPAGPWGPKATVWFDQRWVAWDAITIGRDIFVSGARVDAGLLSHEYTHVVQTEAAGGFQPYLRMWAMLTARYGYRQNQLEVEGFGAPGRLRALWCEYGVPRAAQDEHGYGPGDTWHPPHLEQRPGGPVLRYGGVEYPRPVRHAATVRGSSPGLHVPNGPVRVRFDGDGDTDYRPTDG